MPELTRPKRSDSGPCALTRRMGEGECQVGESGLRDVVLQFRNRQKVRRLDTRLLRRMALWVLKERLDARRVELCFHFVDAQRMTVINHEYLEHEGSTDVITFDYSDPGYAEAAASDGAPGRVFHGEAYICVEDAMAQALQFRVPWTTELARYVIHALLHLAGYDDLKSVARQRMKRVENRLVREASAAFELSKLHLKGGHSG